MLELLATMPRNGKWVFSYDSAKHINGFGKLKEKIDALMGDVRSWQNHD